MQNKTKKAVSRDTEKKKINGEPFEMKSMQWIYLKNRRKMYAAHVIAIWKHFFQFICSILFKANEWYSSR